MENLTTKEKVESNIDLSQGMMSVVIDRKLVELACHIADSARPLPTTRKNPALSEAAQQWVEDKIKQEKDARDKQIPAEGQVVTKPLDQRVITPSSDDDWGDWLVQSTTTPAPKVPQQDKTPDELFESDAQEAPAVPVRSARHQESQAKSEQPNSTKKNPRRFAGLLAVRQRFTLKKTVRYAAIAIVSSFSFVGVLSTVGEVTLKHPHIGLATSSLDHGVDPARADVPAKPVTQVVAEKPKPTQSLLPDKNIEVTLGHATETDHKLFVFSDPACPFCKNLEPLLESVSRKGFEVHIFPTPIHTQSFGLVASIACFGGDKAEAWKRAINANKLSGEADCKEAEGVGKRAVDFFTQFGFNATPTIVNAAGATHVGSFATQQQLIDFANNIPLPLNR